MKNGEAAGPSGVVAEMLKAAPDICSKIFADLLSAIIHKGKVLVDLSDSIIVGLLKEKGDSLERKNYCGLILSDHVLKVIEKVVKNIICERANINEMQLGFCPSRGTTNAILFLHSFKKSISRNT